MPWLCCAASLSTQHDSSATAPRRPAFWPYDARTASCVKCQCSNKTQTNKEDSSPRRAVGRTAPIDETIVYFEWTCAANMVGITTPADDNLRLQSYR